ncbi:MAG: phosphatidate cytidylyltransferase [Candidatus Latescibacteria bacterium]|nr:phosphatidate cytidylyltransferase [Candidatus Latescibacterota bacterium]
MNKLAKRTIVGTILGTITAIILYINPLAVFIVLLVWIALATNEFLRILETKQIQINRLLLIGLNLLFPIIFYFKISPIWYLIPPMVFFVYALIKHEHYYQLAPAGIFTLLYLGFLPSHLLYLKTWVWGHQFPMLRGFFVVFFPLAFTWVNDTAAYFVGTLIGRHKLAEKISPNKTIEGFVGSIIVSVAFSYFYLRALFPDVMVWIALGSGFVLSIAAQIGDLVESGFKRDANLKDSSRALGEHGGFLDRVDSLLFTIPIFYYLLIYLIIHE